MAQAKTARRQRRRRQYGTGSIYWSDGEQRWIGAITHGWTRNGTPRRPKVSSTLAGDAGYADCRRKLDALIKRLNQEGPSATATTATTVKSWADHWLTLTVHQKRPKSFATEQSALKRWIVPTIGHKRLDALTVADFRSVAAAMHKGGVAQSTVLRYQSTLRRMLKDAVTEGGLQVNKAIFLVNMPSRGIPDRDRVELAHALLMLQHARDLAHGSRWVAAYVQGMRPGECLGLTWPLVDLEAMKLDNSWQLQEIPFKHGCTQKRGGAWSCGRRFGGHCPARELRIPDGYEYQQLQGSFCLVRPKTEAGKRMMPLIDVMVAELEVWQKIAPASAHGLVWPRSDGRPQDPDLDRADWYALQQRAGVHSPAGRPYYPYEARHTTATILMELGVPDDIQRAILGHSTMQSGRSYRHVSLEAARSALEGVAAKLGLGEVARV